MCRLFGMSSAPLRTTATFWLLDAPDSLADQSRRDPDGTGLGWFTAGRTPRVHRAPVAAYADRAFAGEARSVESATFVAHVRYASTGAPLARNTHPFEQRGRFFAHNGVVEDLDELDVHLGPDLALVHGDTDSERIFALVTRETEARGGDVGAGIENAARWIARNLSVYALNIVVTTADELWALRYPDTHELYVLRRRAGGHEGTRPMEHGGFAGRMRVESEDLSTARAVVVASEPMDDDPGWRLMRPGELVHVAPDLTVTRRIAVPDRPALPLTLNDLRADAAASQRVA